MRRRPWCSSCRLPWWEPQRLGKDAFSSFGSYGSIDGFLYLLIWYWYWYYRWCYSSSNASRKSQLLGSVSVSNFWNTARVYQNLCDHVWACSRYVGITRLAPASFFSEETYTMPRSPKPNGFCWNSTLEPTRVLRIWIIRGKRGRIRFLMFIRGALVLILVWQARANNSFLYQT